MAFVLSPTERSERIRPRTATGQYIATIRSPQACGVSP
jgi:hypothetical protein